MGMRGGFSVLCDICQKQRRNKVADIGGNGPWLRTVYGYNKGPLCEGVLRRLAIYFKNHRDCAPSDSYSFANNSKAGKAYFVVFGTGSKENRTPGENQGRTGENRDKKSGIYPEKKIINIVDKPKRLLYN